MEVPTTGATEVAPAAGLSVSPSSPGTEKSVSFGAFLEAASERQPTAEGGSGGKGSDAVKASDSGTSDPSGELVDPTATALGAAMSQWVAMLGAEGSAIGTTSRDASPNDVPGVAAVGSIAPAVEATAPQVQGVLSGAAAGDADQGGGEADGIPVDATGKEGASRGLPLAAPPSQGQDAAEVASAAVDPLRVAANQSAAVKPSEGSESGHKLARGDDLLGSPPADPRATSGDGAKSPAQADPQAAGGYPSTASHQGRDGGSMEQRAGAGGASPAVAAKSGKSTPSPLGSSPVPSATPQVGGAGAAPEETGNAGATARRDDTVIGGVVAGRVEDARLAPPAGPDMPAEGDDPSGPNRELFDQILEQASKLSVPRNTSLRVHLKPASLGSIDLRLGLTGRVLTLHILAEVDQTRDMIGAALPQLRQALEGRSIEVGQLSLGAPVDGSGGPGSYSDPGGQWAAGRRSLANMPRISTPREEEPATVFVQQSGGGGSRRHLVDYRV